MSKANPENGTSYQALVDAIGKVATDRLLAHYRGRRIWIPVAVESKSVMHRRQRNPMRGLQRKEIGELLGVEVAEKLFTCCGGMYMQLPTGLAALKQDCRRQAAELHRAGKTVGQIAATLMVHRRSVTRWLNLPAQQVYGSE